MHTYTHTWIADDQDSEPLQTMRMQLQLKEKCKWMERIMNRRIRENNAGKVQIDHTYDNWVLKEKCK